MWSLGGTFTCLASHFNAVWKCAEQPVHLRLIIVRWHRDEITFPAAAPKNQPPLFKKHWETRAYTLRHFRHSLYLWSQCGNYIIIANIAMDILRRHSWTFKCTMNTKFSISRNDNNVTYWQSCQPIVNCNVSGMLMSSVPAGSST